MSGAPVGKRGGMRRPLRRKPTQKQSAHDIFKEVGSQFAKKLTQYRYLICTDMSPEDLLFLELFAGWLKVNEKVIDKGNNFPIYGFITPNSPNNKIRAQRIREYLGHIGYTMGWDDPEHHLYKGFEGAGNRIWFDGPIQQVEGEQNLLRNTEAVDDADYPTPQDLNEGLQDIKKLKPANVMLVKLCNVFNEEFNKIAHEFVQIQIPTNGKMLTDKTASKFLKELERSEDEEDFGVSIRKSMFVYNDNRLEKLKEQLPEVFKKVDWEDYNSFKEIADKNPDVATEHVSTLLKEHSRIINSSKAQVMLNLLGRGNIDIEKVLVAALKLF